MKSNPTIMILCPGAGIDRRGFEMGALHLFDLLKDEAGVDFYLVKSSPAGQPRELRVRSVYRQSFLARALALVLRRSPYVIQNFSFFLFLIPTLVRRRPRTLYLADPPLYGYLLRYRRLTGASFRMIFHTGGNTIPIRHDHRDIFQCVIPSTAELALHRGVKPVQIRHLPHVVDAISNSSRSKMELRKELQIPEGRVVLLSVGAIDRSIKRMDYLVAEVSKLTEPFYLIVLGQMERETNEIINLAAKLLPAGSYRFDTVTREVLEKYYSAADIFALASPDEGFCRSSVEALAHGMPVLMNDFRNARDVLGPMGYFTDMLVDGNLTKLIQTFLPFHDDIDKVRERSHFVASRYSWQVLKPLFRQMFNDGLGDQRSSQGV